MKFVFKKVGTKAYYKVYDNNAPYATNDHYWIELYQLWDGKSEEQIENEHGYYKGYNVDSLSEAERDGNAWLYENEKQGLA